MNYNHIKELMSNCCSYAEELSRKNNIYPRNAKISFENLFRYDALRMLGFIFDKSSADELGQIRYINETLGLKLNVRLFDDFRKANCPEEKFLKEIPESLQYFVKDDLNPYSRRTMQGISISKYIVDSLNDFACGFAAFDGVSEYENERIWQYISMLRKYLTEYGLDSWRNPTEYVAPKQDDYEGYSSDKYGTPIIEFGKKRSGVRNDISEKKEEAPEEKKQQSSDVESTLHSVGFTSSVDTGLKEGMLEQRWQEKEETLEELMTKLNQLIGLAEVKKNIETQVNLIKIQTMRQNMHLPTLTVSLHLVFSGNPGTGKTTVARLLAKIYKQLGVVKKGQFVEVDRAGLVEGYVGQTAQKTSEVIDSAIGGVLFIDEAYTLTNNKEKGDYGQEAVDTLLKRMEDDRDKFVVIVAGYTKEMEEFVSSNPGLESRFSKFISFPDYTGEELFLIFEGLCKSMQFTLEENAKECVRKKFMAMEMCHEENFANGREVRNFFDRCVERQANRLAKAPNLKAEDLTIFTEADVTE